jgi:hypothetical protein
MENNQEEINTTEDEVTEEVAEAPEDIEITEFDDEDVHLFI